MEPKTWYVLVVLVLMLAAGQTAAETFIVDCGGNGDFVTLQEGLSACALGDTVLVEPGVYTGPANRDLVPVSSHVTVIGVAGASATVIDCEYAGKGFELDEMQGCSFRGLTITRGRSSAGQYPKAAGGAVYSYNSNPTFVDCAFSECHAPNLGGAVYSYVDAPVFLRCVFSDNWCDPGYTTYGGGGIAGRFVDGCWQIQSCVFEGNHTEGLGGAINIDGGDGVVLVDFTSFIGNSSAGSCGAVRIYGVPCMLTNCTFASNSSDRWCSNLCCDELMEVSHCILSFGICEFLECESIDGVFQQCCVFGNAEGDTLPWGPGDNMTADPLYCDLSEHDVSLMASSPCLPSNNAWGVLVGAHGQGCEGTSMEESSWGRVKSLYR